MSRGNSQMLAAPEVLALNSLLIQVSGARLVLDIGVFTGASSLSAALALGEGGRVVALEKSRTYGKIATRWVEGRDRCSAGQVLDRGRGGGQGAAEDRARHGLPALPPTGGAQ